MESSKWADPPVQQSDAPTNANSESFPSISIPAPSYDLDEFAQTRESDDLFGDDFTPIAEPVIEPNPPRQPRGDITSRGGRGRGGRRGTGFEARADRRPIAATTAKTAEKKSTPAAPVSPSAPQDASQTVSQPEAPRTEAVRGDRSGTGGVKKAKLTEEELSARMEAIKLKNASLEAAHARAEADQASFHAREAEAFQRRQQERQINKQMMGEREKNRLRKLNAVKGREWDAEKDANERSQDLRPGQGQYTRGAHGGVSGPRVGGRDGHVDTEQGLQENFREQQIRGGGRTMARGKARGSRDSGKPLGAHRNGHQAVPSDADFPALQPSKASTTSSKISITPPKETTLSDSAPVPAPSVAEPLNPPSLIASQAKKSWADEMESPITPITTKNT